MRINFEFAVNNEIGHLHQEIFGNLEPEQSSGAFSGIAVTATNYVSGIAILAAAQPVRARQVPPVQPWGALRSECMLRCTYPKARSRSALCPDQTGTSSAQYAVTDCPTAAAGLAEN